MSTYHVFPKLSPVNSSVSSHPRCKRHLPRAASGCLPLCKERARVGGVWGGRSFLGQDYPSILSFKREEGEGENVAKDFTKSSCNHFGCSRGRWCGIGTALRYLSLGDSLMELWKGLGIWGHWASTQIPPE